MTGTEAASYEYLPWRGVTKNSMEFYGVKTKINSEGKPLSLGYPYSNGAYKIRRLDHKDFYSEGSIGEAGLFGKERFSSGSAKAVVITEGELDAISLWQVLKIPCVSVQSANSSARDCIRDLSYLNSFERVYLAFDGDSAGREAESRVARLFDFNRVYQIKFDKRKDANAYLEAGEETELREMYYNAKRYLPSSIVSSFSDFKKILEEPNKASVSYPFPTLSEMTYGLRTGEVVLLTALEGVGKTEIMHAIEYHLLRKTSDPVGAIYLEEVKKRHLQAIAGLALGKPVHLPDSGVTDDQILTALEGLLQVDDRLYIYSHFGSDDPDILLDTIRFLVSARGCRFVLLDHITMAVSGVSGEDERRALDYLSTKLEMMVKELDFGLILVSHVNDEGQTRGSRYISKIADVRIDCTRNVIANDNTIYLTVSKNRFGAKTGPAGVLKFNPETFQIKEELWA